ncbi:MAG: hypothetical protein JOZ19_06455 [Rubrobacter sp.]|nr:hypothetical protein [Rubrobacter sp.]
MAALVVLLVLALLGTWAWQSLLTPGQMPGSEALEIASQGSTGTEETGAEEGPAGGTREEFVGIQEGPSEAWKAASGSAPRKAASLQALMLPV